MCFGSKKETTTKTNTPNAAVESAAQQNLSAVSGLQNTGYQPYEGERVAPFSDLQNQSFDIASNIGSNTNPYLSATEQGIANYGSAPAQTVQSDTIANNMSPYMNQYVMQALAPQIEQQNQQFAQQNKQMNSAATSSGAFGDKRAGIEASNLTNQQNIGRTGLIGNAYNNAFQTAIGAGAQDVANKMSAQRDTGSFMEQALQRQLGGANALTALDASQQARLNNQYGITNAAGKQQQEQAQAELNVPYSDYLAAQQYPFLTSQAMNSAISAANPATTSTQTGVTEKPDNSGWSLLGALGGAAISKIPFSDERLKEQITPIGKLDDGKTNVVTYRYKGDPQPRIGVVAQDVEKSAPQAVGKVGGMRFVNYDILADAMGKAA